MIHHCSGSVGLLPEALLHDLCCYTKGRKQVRAHRRVCSSDKENMSCDIQDEMLLLTVQEAEPKGGADLRQ